MEYKTVGREISTEFTEKKSRFIGHVKPVSSESDALAFLTEKRERFKDASHNVYTYIIREQNLERFSDDGEPSGTAGMPALEVIKREGLCDLIVVVTRYFGGTLLGAGGLVRAYARSAKEAIDAAGIVTMKQSGIYELTYPYSLHGRLQNEFEAMGISVIDIRYAADVRAVFAVPDEALSRLSAAVSDATRGEGTLIHLENRFYPAP